MAIIKWEIMRFEVRLMCQSILGSGIKILVRCCQKKSWIELKILGGMSASCFIPCLIPLGGGDTETKRMVIQKVG